MHAGVVAASLRHRDVNYPLRHRVVQIWLKNMFNLKVSCLRRGSNHVAHVGGRDHQTEVIDEASVHNVLGRVLLGCPEQRYDGA